MFNGDEEFAGPRLLVVGAGGGGCNAVKRMLEEESSRDIQFLAVNTDQKALNTFEARENLTILPIGRAATKGLGAGARPEVGEMAAMEDEQHLNELLAGFNMVFVTCGEGGGTGTGAAPVIAKIAKKNGALVVGVVTRPFGFEGQKRFKYAEAGIAALKDNVDTLLIVENDRISNAIGKHVPFHQSLKMADNVLAGAVMAIYAIMNDTGLINVDFADVRTVMIDGGMALMGTGEQSLTGEDPRAATNAALQAIDNPLLSNVNIKGARSCLVNISGGMNLTHGHIEEVTEVIKTAVGDNTEIIFGAVIDAALEDTIRVTVVATGFEMPAKINTTHAAPRTLARPTQTTRPATVPPANTRGPSTAAPSWMHDEQDEAAASHVPARAHVPANAAPALPTFLQGNRTGSR